MVVTDSLLSEEAMITHLNGAYIAAIEVELFEINRFIRSICDGVLDFELIVFI